MERKQTLQYFKPGDLTGLEAYLNAMSEKGWQCVRPGRLRQCFLREDGVWVHRFDYSEAPKGSAEEITHSAALERAGWEVAARRKGWLLCRKRADRAEAARPCPAAGSGSGHGSKSRSPGWNRCAGSCWCSAPF